MRFDRDTLKVLGIDSLERHRDPLDVRLCPILRKGQVFELCGLGEVKENHPRYVWVRVGRSGAGRSQKLKETHSRENIGR